jgi:hypothetical protein
MGHVQLKHGLRRERIGAFSRLTLRGNASYTPPRGSPLILQGMNNETKTRASAGLAAVITGVMLIGTTGLTFAFGWALWAAGLGVLLAAVPSAGDRRPRGRDAAPARYSLVP